MLEVHRARVGDTLVVGMQDGRMGEGRVTRLTSKELEMEVSLNTSPPAKLPVILCVALMRPLVLKRVLQTAATMGVQELHIFHSRQVEKSFWQSSALAKDEIHEQLVLGLEQARDTVIPPVVLHKRFKPFVEDVLPGLLNGRAGIVADPSGTACIPECHSPKVLVIGPEGGFIPYELQMLGQAGCAVISLGPRILTVETAVPALLARLFPC